MASRDQILDWINVVLKSQNWDLQDWAAAADVDHTTLWRFTTGASKKLRKTTIAKLAKAAGSKPPDMSVETDDDVIAAVSTPADIGAHFTALSRGETLFEVSSDALRPFDLAPGDLLIFDAAETPKNGDLVLVAYHDRQGGLDKIIREYWRPYLIAPAGELERRILMEDGDTVKVTAVLTKQLRLKSYR